MNSAIDYSASQGQTMTVDAIKKAFIRLNELDAANEQFAQGLADEAHIKQVKVWLQNQERELGIKAQVISGEGTHFMDATHQHFAPGAVSDGIFQIAANTVKTHQQAIQAYEYVVVGLGLLPGFLGKKQSEICRQIFASLNDKQKDFLIEQFHCDENNADSIEQGIMAYLAKVAALAIEPSFVQRRESWQRSILRRFHSKLAWTHNDLLYLIHRARSQAKS